MSIYTAIYFSKSVSHSWQFVTAKFQYDYRCFSLASQTLITYERELKELFNKTPCSRVLTWWALTNSKLGMNFSLFTWPSVAECKVFCFAETISAPEGQCTIIIVIEALCYRGLDTGRMSLRTYLSCYLWFFSTFQPSWTFDSEFWIFLTVPWKSAVCACAYEHNVAVMSNLR